MHWGTEYDTGTTATQRDEANQLLASPCIDLILGDHPHVVEPAQQLHGKWVIYSMGNQISRHANPLLVSREGAMPMFTFTETSPGHFAVTDAAVVPTLMQLTPKLRLIDLPRALADPAPQRPTAPPTRRRYARPHDHRRDGRRPATGCASASWRGSSPSSVRRRRSRCRSPVAAECAGVGRVQQHPDAPPP